MHRQALRYIIRNTTLPPRTRAIAQLQLTQMHCYTRPTQIRNRCIMGGKGRGVLGDFKLSRVRRTANQLQGRRGLTLVQYNFRMEALAGNLPGVKKASW
jgi:small subunit ribosomal protein S14